MNLDYLTLIFRGSASRLDVEAVTRSSVVLKYAVTNYSTGHVEYRIPTKNSIFDLMSASASIPLVDKPVIIGNERYVDGGLVDPLPVNQALEEGYDEITAVYNKPLGFNDQALLPIPPLFIALFLPPSIAKLMSVHAKSTSLIIQKSVNDCRVTLINPATPLPLKSRVDTNKNRLNMAIDQGIVDANRFLTKLNQAVAV